MLAGPQSSHFDPNSFRTGFTPDLSNFKTGLTPLGGGMSFPPPSPNTAAFLAAMVNNSASTSTATITPNTLSALTNAANASTNGGSMDPSGASGPGVSTQPQAFAGKPQGDAAHNAFDLAFSRSFPGDKGGSKLKAEVKGDGSERSGSTSISPQMVQKQLEGSSGEQQNAASGLFLLSRAHQEMSKREGNSTSLYESKPAPASAKKGAAKKADPKPNGNKRKKSGSADDSIAAPSTSTMNAPPAKAAKTAKGKKNGAAPEAPALGSSENGGDDNEEWGDSDEDGEKGPMDEKRKNFLERNRQAALKCRQRKKAWLASLQAKVEYLQNDNENLQNTVGALRNENMFLKSQLVQATGGAPLPPPMGMPHMMDPHHSMAQGAMGMTAMAPHPAYMSGPPGPPGVYAGVPMRGPGQMGGFDPHMAARQGRPRSEGDVLAGTGEGGVKHEREWSAASVDAGKPSAATQGAGAGIKV